MGRWQECRKTGKERRKEHHFEYLGFAEPLGHFCVDPPTGCHKCGATAQERNLGWSWTFGSHWYIGGS